MLTVRFCGVVFLVSCIRALPFGMLIRDSTHGRNAAIHGYFERADDEGGKAQKGFDDGCCDQHCQQDEEFGSHLGRLALKNVRSCLIPDCCF